MLRSIVDNQELRAIDATQSVSPLWSCCEIAKSRIILIWTQYQYEILRLPDITIRLKRLHRDLNTITHDGASLKRHHHLIFCGRYFLGNCNRAAAVFTRG